jgi:hypothetical protein
LGLLSARYARSFAKATNRKIFLKMMRVFRMRAFSAKGCLLEFEGRSWRLREAALRLAAEKVQVDVTSFLWTRGFLALSESARSVTVVLKPADNGRLPNFARI